MTHTHPDPVTAFESRQDARDARAQAKARAQGITHARCARCGHLTRDLGRIREECREFDDMTDDQMCGGTYRPFRLN